jgi:hypothetical protein
LAADTDPSPIPIGGLPGLLEDVEVERSEFSKDTSAEVFRASNPEVFRMMDINIESEIRKMNTRDNLKGSRLQIFGDFGG